MPLNTTGLVSDLTAFFSSPSAVAGGVGGQWAEAMNNYASGIIPASTTVTAASNVLETTLSGILIPPTNVSPTIFTQFDSAFLAFATTVGLGMLPAWAAVPPAAVLGSDTLSAVQPTSAAAAAVWAAKIDLWMRTGTATLVSPPNTVVLWS